MKKRFGKLRRPLSVLLAVCMLLSSISVGLTVFAADMPDKKDVKASAKDYANVISTLSADMDFRKEVDQLTKAKDTEALYKKLVVLMNDPRIASYLNKFSWPSTPSGVRIRVSVADTEDGLFAKMSHILYGLVYSIGIVNKGGGDNTWLTAVATTIENDLRSRLSSAVYSSNRIELIVRRLLGTWDEGTTDTSTTDCFTFLTQPAPNKTYLKRYDTLADVPDKVWTQMAETICHQRGGSWPKYKYTFDWGEWSAVTYNDEEMRADHATMYGGMGQPDTTSKAALNAFNAVFTHDVLTKEVSEWTPAEMKTVLDNGSAALAGIVGMDSSVGDHFFKQAGDTYAQDAFARANALYKEAESYGQQAYINQITKTDNAYGGDYAIQSADLDPMETALNEAVDLYELLSAGQKANVASEKATYDALLKKFLSAQTAIYTDEYAAMIAELANALRNPFIKNTVTANVVLDDDMDGTVKHAADLYLGLAKRFVTLEINAGKPANHTTTSICLKILSDLYNSMGDDYYSCEVERVLGLVGCTNSSDTVSFEVNNNPLAYRYQDISEIPASVEHTRTTYTYTYTNGAVANKASMTSADQGVTDHTAKTVFDLWAATLTVDFISQDLSALDYTALKSVKDQTLAAIDGVSAYTKVTLDHLLTPVTMAIAKDTWMPYINASMAALFVKNANALYETYFGIDGAMLSDQEMEIFKAKMTEAYANYSELDAPYTGQDDVVAAKEKLDALQGAFSGIIAAYNLRLYMDLANQMTPYMNADLSAARALTMQDLAPLRSLIKGVENRYGALTAEQKATAEVIEKERIRAILEAARQAAVNTPAWRETTVDYSGIPNATADNALDLISKLDELINGALVKSLLQVPEGQSFGDYAYGMFEQLVFTDDTINAIMKMLYPMVKQNLPPIATDTVLGMAGLYVTPKKLVDSAKLGNDYPYMRAELQRVANNSNNWDDVDWTKMQWIDVSSGTENPVHDAASFCKALGLMLKGVWPVVKALLNNEGLILDIVKGNAGYDKVVYPLLLQLGCKDVTTPQALYDGRNDQYWYMPKLLMPLFNRIKEMLQSPVSTVMEFLPTISYLFSYNMLEEGLAELGSPLSGLGVNLVSIIRDAGIDLSDLNALLQGDLLSGLLGGLKLPLINTGEVAGIAKKTGDGYGTLKGKITLAAKKDEMAIYVLRYALDLVKANPDLINGLLANMDDSIKGLVSRLLANDNDKILNTLFGVLYPKDIAAVDWDMKDWQFNSTDTDYADTTNAKAKKAVQQLDVILNVVMKQFLKMDLSTLMGDNLFTDENLNNLTMTIYRLLGSADLAILPQLLGIDISPSAMADALQTYPEVADVLRAAQSWDTVDLTGRKWINPASETSVSDQFAMALARLFKPFNPLLKVLLTGEDVSLLDGMITLKGAAGYSNAILPLLSALSCDALTEKEYTKLIADSGEESMLFSILKPIFDKVDTLLASPVGTLAEMLPNFAYFLDNGGLTKAFNALLLPLTNITDEVLPLFADEDGNVPTLFDFILNLVGDMLPETVKPILEKIDFNNLDASIFPLIQSILGNLTIGETTLQIKLPDLDWGTLAGRGDRKTDGGMWGALTGWLTDDPTTYHVEADSGAVLMGVLNYVFAAVKENKDLLFGLLGGAESTDLMTLVKQLLTDVLANEPAAMSAAVINVLSIENPEDDDWNMADFVHDLAEKLYGDDLDQQRVRGAIVKADQMVAGAAKLFLPAGTEDLGQLVQNSLYTNQMATTLFKTIYSALGTEEIGSVMGTLGLNVTPADLANILTADKYPAVNALLAGKSTWAEVFATTPSVDGEGNGTPVSPWDTVSWGVDDAQSFASALAAMFRPFSGVLQALLLKGGDFDFELAGYKVKSANGYKDAILPLLGALGCTEEDGVLAADAYKAAVQSDPDALLVNILMPILNWVDRVCASPVDVLTKILPNFAYFLNNDGLTRSLKNLLKPITNIADQLMPLFKDENGNVPDSIDFVLDLVSKMLVLPEGLDLKALLNDPKTNLIPLVNSFLKDLTVGEATLNIQLPAIDWGKLAGCGEVKTSAEAPFFAKFTANAQYKYVEADQENALLVIMTYVCKVLVENKDALLGLVGTLPEAIQPYVDTLLSNSPEDLAKAIVKVINTKDILDDDWDMTDFLWAVNAAAYTEGVNAETVAQAITRIDELIVHLVPALTQGQSLKDLVSTNLYTDSLVSTLVSAIYQAIGSNDVAAVFTTLGIQITPADMAAVWADYPEVASALTGKTSWAEVDLTNASWNVTDANSFAKALAAAFRPFNPILKALLLKGNDYKLAGIYEIKSANGYKDAILPLLGALGCTDVLSADDFKNAVAGDQDQLLVSILKPILGLVDRVCAAPVDTLAGILPNLAYFLDNKGLTRCLTNLAKPITNILDELLPLLQENGGSLDALSHLLSGLLPDGLDLNNLEGTIIPTLQKLLQEGIQIGETTLHITLPDFTWGAIAGHGTEKTSADAPFLAKLTGNKNYKYIEADKGDLVMAVMNYLVSAVQANKDQILSLLGGLITDETTLNMVTGLINKGLENDPEVIAGALIKLLMTTEPEDVDWGTLIWNLSEALYPEGVTSARMDEAAQTADKAIKNALSAFAGINLTSLLSGQLYTNSNISALVSALYGAVGTAEIAPILTLLKVDVSTKAVAQRLAADYPSVSKTIQAADSWADVNLSSANWNVTDRSSFAKALAASLRPFDGLLNLMLAGKGQTLAIADAVPVYGANGYANAVMPLLSALGCTNLLSADAYASAAKQDSDTLLTAIVEPVLALVERVADKPVQTLAEILPNFAYFMSNNGLSKALNALLLPITNVADPILSLVTEKSLLSFILEVAGVDLPIDLDRITDSIVPLLNTLLGNLEINGQKLALELPSIDWAALAGYGTLEKVPTTGLNRVVANTADTTLAVLRYVAKILSYKENPKAIQALVGSLASSDLIDQIVKNVTSADADSLVTMIVDLLAPNGDGLQGSWSYKEIGSITTTEFTKNLTREDFAKALPMLDNIIPIKLDVLLSSKLYTKSMMGTLTSSIFGLLNPETLGFDVLDILKKVGIDMTPSGVASQLKESKFQSLKTSLAKADSWTSVDFTTLDWGFSDGSQDGFMGTLAALLRPLSGVLGALLNGTDLVLLDSIHIKGGTGYNNAIIPLLEALGCKNILSAAEYAAQAQKNPDSLILAIINPLLDRVNELLQKPFSTLTELIPNLAYFLYNDGLGQLATNLLLPITKLLEEVSPVYDIDLNLSALNDLDPIDLINSLDIGIQLPSIDWKTLASRGTPVTYMSEQVDANGNRITATKVDSDQPAVLAVTLRYVLNTLGDRGNINGIKELLMGVDPSGTASTIVGMVLALAAAYGPDTTIEAIFSFLLNIGTDNNGNNNKPTPTPTPNPDDGGDADTTEPNGSGDDYSSGTGTDDGWISGDSGDSDDGQTEETTVEETTVEETTPPAENPLAPVDPGDEPAETEEKDNLPLIIGLSVGGAVLVIAIGVAVWLILRKKKNAAAVPATGKTDSEEEK